ncbi:hypothetical protein KR51_00004370 [Rubidibacter lacunae KORDI 51-2]|uniref:DUF4350 domain-containing protein n=1 Tax=Rubidibacter lacunae KORDI 51-2 TaxID=582515 RepID=U5DQC6_9CHRO|nr:DUF4350 domain-containing protein [Rubidibacter lacunae]ERN42819.1 hypothetical protein KR51_00004370 [Rubidibacter lacunae KORDI 51-2]
MSQSRQRLWTIGAILLGAMLLGVLLFAPASRPNSGSTYNSNPDGYAAWYAFMQERGYPIQRWQRPPHDIEALNAPATFVRVHPELPPDMRVPADMQSECGPGSFQSWVEDGNTLVVLGMRQPPTTAPFDTLQDSPVGEVRIQTTRRLDPAAQGTEVEPIVSDRYGMTVWERALGDGRAICVITPHLAANAYQDYPNNFALLARLAGADAGRPIWVDEYIHGYKDAVTATVERQENVFDYLSSTPLFVAFLQIVIVLIIFLSAANRRFGPAIALRPPETNNSQAYISALAGAIYKAERYEFATDLIGKAERLKLQQALGLGTVPLSDRELRAAWVQCGGSEEELKLALRGERRRRPSETELLDWLQHWQAIHRAEDSR